MATSLSSSSSSSSRDRFCPLFSSVVVAAVGGFDGSADDTLGTAVVVEPGTGALKILCCKSVSSAGAFADVGILKVPSSFAMMLDLDFAYETFYAPVRMILSGMACVYLLYRGPKS